MQRMGRVKWQKILTHLQASVRRAKNVDALSGTEYQNRIGELRKDLQATLNVIEHRGKNGPPRWPRDDEKGGRS